jgi:ABC-type polysaccharide/polyol phosphate transport system ATPase subunit
MAIVKFSDVWEMYRLKLIIEGKVYWENFWALRGVSFDLGERETLGIVGANGAGKSTILKLIMGMLKPDRGEVNISGRVSGLLELGAGFQPELSGMENIHLNARLFGLGQKEIEEKLKDIIDFAEIGRFINAPVKCYSQGMFVRLAFAVAIHVNPDILLIDDILAVGDEHYQRKCISRIFELKEKGKTIIFVSHDLNMLNRLCKRMLFIKDGRIVKDDAAEKIISLYTQTIGIKEGVGMLEKEPLNIVFNNGSLLINWQDKLLTPNSGIYASFFLFNKSYNSLSAEWTVNKENESTLTAIGKFYKLGISQIWRVEIAGNHEIKLNIELNFTERPEIKEGYLNIMLTDEYVRWFTAIEEGEFPNIRCQDRNWKALLENDISRKCIGIKGIDAPGANIPPLIAEQNNYSLATRTQIYNADYITNCRVLQYKIADLHKNLPKERDCLSFFSGRILLNVSDADNYLRGKEDEFILSDGKLRLTFENGRAVLCYNGINLTKANHLATAICIKGQWHFSNSAHWEVKKENKKKLVARGNWLGLPIEEIWEIEITGNSSFIWKVNLAIKEEAEIEEQYLCLMCSEDYTYWFSDYGRGLFPEYFLESNMDMLQRCIPEGIVGIQSQSNPMPSISVRFSENLNNFAKIVNSDFHNRARILRVQRVESEKDVKFLPGEYACLDAEVILDEDTHIHIDNSVNILQNNKLRFIFDKGKGQIYWGEKELTKRMGLYTSLRSKGRWHDSISFAIWKIEERNKNILKTYGKWLHLPIIQCWEIKVIDGKFIDFNIKMKVEKEIEVDRLQTNLMLLEKYSHWLTDNARGPFPLFKGNVDDDWDCIYNRENDCGYIAVSDGSVPQGNLPLVKLISNETDSDCILNIVNSDIYHRGRVLQYLNPKYRKIPTGEYDYFSGKIIIES